MKQKSWQRIRAWWPVVSIYAVLFFLSHQSKLPGPEEVTFQFLWFKLGHLIAYGILGWCVIRAMTWQQAIHTARKNVSNIWWKVLLIVAVLAALDEIHQMFVPGRGPHVRDVFIDIAGAGAAVLWWRYFPVHFFKTK